MMVLPSADFRLAFLLMVRSRLILTGLLLCAVVAACTWLVAQFSPRQPGTVALDVGISLIRIAVPVLALLQIQDLVMREVERKLILFSMTYPRPRAAFLLGRYLAVIAASFGVTASLALTVAIVVASIGPASAQGTQVALGLPYVLTCALIWCDVAVVVAFGTALAVVATTPHLVFVGGLGFMIIARSATAVIALLEREQDLLPGADLYHQGLLWVQWIIPDLGALDVRAIALYGKMELLTIPAWAMVAMPLGCIGVLLSFSIYRFARREFT